ncbi:hypothetical protein ABZP36_001676 [Zizania latifolia]
MSSATEEILPDSTSAELFSAAPSFSYKGEEPGASDGGGTGEGLDCAFKNLDDSKVFVVDEMGKDGSFRSLRERRSNRTVTAAEFKRTFGSSPFICELMRWVDDSDEPSTVVRGRRRKKRFGWLRVVDVEEDDETNWSCSGKVNRVKVPVHELYGHDDVILDLSWSKKGTYFLPPWIKLYDCGKLGAIVASRFSHIITMGAVVGTITGNCRYYDASVTCVQFHPASDKYFISGCINRMVIHFSVKYWIYNMPLLSI